MLLVLILLIKVNQIIEESKPEFKELTFELGNTTVLYSHNEMEVDIRDEGHYEIYRVFEKTPSRETSSGWNKLYAPYENTFRGYGYTDYYFGRNVEYIKIIDVQKHMSEYIDIESGHKFFEDERRWFAEESE